VNAPEPRLTIANDPDALGEVETLLARYPDVSEAERDRIGGFLRKGAAIDIGLLSSNARLWHKAERFRADNPVYFRLGARFYLFWALAIAAIVGTLVLIKDIGLN
jgi:hypothetical protein